MTADEAIEMLHRRAAELSTGDLARDLELLVEAVEADAPRAAAAAEENRQARRARALEGGEA